MVTKGDNVNIREGVVLRPEGGFIAIGNNVVINHYTAIHAKGGVEIGDWTVIAPNCGLYAQNHSFNSFDQPITLQENNGKGIYLMGDNWLGANAVILDNVNLGKGCVVGAGAVVTKSFPMGAVVAGVPAKVIKWRYDPETWNMKSHERINRRTPEEYRGYLQQRIKFAKDYVKDDDVSLDIGCGNGEISRAVRATYAIDYCGATIDYHKHHLPDGVKFLHSPCTYLDFPDKTFDRVMAFEVIEHITPLMAHKMLEEVRRVLKPGCLFIGSTPEPSGGPQTYSHIKEYTRAELRQLLETHFGFVTINASFFVAR